LKCEEIFLEALKARFKQDPTISMRRLAMKFNLAVTTIWELNS
jgi:hypothetical protein